MCDDATGAAAAAKAPESPWVTGFKILYFVVLFVVSVPVICFALAAYEYQQEARQLAGNDPATTLALLVDSDTDASYAQRWLQLVAEARSADDGQRTSQQALAGRLFDEAADARPRGDAAEASTAALLAANLQRLERLRHLSFGLLSPNFFTGLPSWALTLLVTILAGLLGSFIFVLQATLRGQLDAWRLGTPHKPWPAPWFFLRPILGVVTAIGAYVAAQTGLLAVDVFATDQSRNADAYFMVFVGLSAGLLCWHAIDFLDWAGRRVFTMRRARWAYGLDAGLKAAEARGAQRAELARRMDVAPEVLADWAELCVPVPPGQQTKVARVVGMDPHCLFLARPPWDRGWVR